MQCFFILCAPSGETEIFFDVINISVDNGADFVGFIPVFGSTEVARICPEVLFGINIYYFAGNGRCARILTMTDVPIFSVFTFVSCSHRADEFLTSNAVL